MHSSSNFSELIYSVFCVNLLWFSESCTSFLVIFVFLFLCFSFYLAIHTFCSVHRVMYFIHIFVDVCVYCLVKVFINFIGAL